MSDFVLFSGSSHPQLASEISLALGCPLGKVSLNTFADGETGVQIQSDVNGKEVFVVQSIARKPNHYLMELFILIDALMRSSAKSITAIIPYFGYARQDRKDQEGVPITAKLVANFLKKAGLSRVLTVDLHTPQIQGFFDIPVENLQAKDILIDAIKKLNLQNLVVVSPDLGSNKMAQLYASELNAGIAIVNKKRDNLNEIVSGSLIGSVNKKDVLIVDDIFSTGKTLNTAKEICKKSNANKVYAAFTHYLGGEKLLENHGFEKIFTTNTIASIFDNPEIETISIASHFAQAIECVLNEKSISSLYR